MNYPKPMHACMYVRIHIEIYACAYVHVYVYGLQIYNGEGARDSDRWHTIRGDFRDGFGIWI